MHPWRRRRRLLGAELLQQRIDLSVLGFDERKDALIPEAASLVELSAGHLDRLLDKLLQHLCAPSTRSRLEAPDGK